MGTGKTTLACRFLLPIMLIVTSACIITDYFESVFATQTPTASTTPSPTLTPSRTITISPSVTQTKTPTATTTLTSTISATVTLTPTQELPPARFPQTPVPVSLSQPYISGQVRILLVGVDNRQSEITRADSIILLSLNPEQGTASLLSIPPDLYVYIPEVGMERISSAQYFGGIGKVLDTVEYNLGVRANKYLAIDLQNFLKVQETTAPITVIAANRLTDRCDIPGATTGWCVVQPGSNVMNADKTLWYVRSRNGGEMERMRRAQEVLIAIFNRHMDLRSPAQITELYAVYASSVETNITTEDLANLTPLAVTLYTNRSISQYSLSSNEAVPGTLPGGENILFLDQRAAWNVIRQAVFQP